ncbi:molybdopterin adenylyltransferase [Azospirillum sp. TSO22-1]|uniref:molybdopterin adenylyltransferase n=1 Tax=Azospirillum sp. TSO22-1 TaxID=716789 RepID=UPI000D620935|nr:molybdopterin adenylyltransferase [Azospirillum sp. TSO22-1]PWC53913.1 molybdopterin adenylyltransferase [Azospirillum sp. TSO22-1]
MTTPGRQRPLKIGIVTVSDRASRGIYEDKGGPAIHAELSAIVTSPWEPVARVIPDDLEGIVATLTELADAEGCDLIVTTGGTGPAPRDVTPEATERVCQKMMPGFGELMRTVSLTVVPTAILSRQTAGIRGTSLIVNLPGKPSAIHDCLMAVFPAIPYCLDLIGGAWIDTDAAVCKAFRPKS